MFFWPLPPVWKAEPQDKFQKAFSSSSLRAVKRPGPSSYHQASLLEESPWALTHFLVRKLQPRGKESSPKSGSKAHMHSFTCSGDIC